jgi:hypothetical protein
MHYSSLRQVPLLEETVMLVQCLALTLDWPRLCGLPDRLVLVFDIACLLLYFCPRTSLCREIRF